jgi:hypothetical protein
MCVRDAAVAGIEAGGKERRSKKAAAAAATEVGSCLLGSSCWRRQCQLAARLSAAPRSAVRPRHALTHTWAAVIFMGVVRTCHRIPSAWRATEVQALRHSCLAGSDLPPVMLTAGMQTKATTVGPPAALGRATHSELTAAFIRICCCPRMQSC